jgi:hypothetical protein
MNISQVPFRTYSASKHAGRPGLTGNGALVSPVNCLGHSSIQTNGRIPSRSRVYTSRISSVPAANSAFAFGGMHHFRLCPGLKASFFNVRRMVSRDTVLASVYSSVTRVFSNNRKPRWTHPSGAGPHTSTTNRASSSPVRDRGLSPRGFPKQQAAQGLSQIRPPQIAAATPLSPAVHT